MAKYVLVSPTHMLERLNNNQIFQAVTKKAVIFHMVEIGNFAGFKQFGETQKEGRMKLLKKLRANNEQPLVVYGCIDEYYEFLVFI